nr:MAG TPA: Zinc-finger double domain protein [Caudoviricetes sp.]
MCCFAKRTCKAERHTGRSLRFLEKTISKPKKCEEQPICCSECDRRFYNGKIYIWQF